MDRQRGTVTGADGESRHSVLEARVNSATGAYYRIAVKQLTSDTELVSYVILILGETRTPSGESIPHICYAQQPA